jgi:hypothetical protein
MPITGRNRQDVTSTRVDIPLRDDRAVPSSVEDDNATTRRPVEVFHDNVNTII